MTGRRSTVADNERRETILAVPAFLAKRLPENKKTICIDLEIAHTIHFLWTNEIETLGCCSGHGKEDPSVIISEHYTDEDAGRIRRLIRTVDQRPWRVLQWRLVEA